MDRDRELCTRHSLDTIDQMVAMVHGMDHKRLRYKDLIRK